MKIVLHTIWLVFLLAGFQCNAFAQKDFSVDSLLSKAAEERRSGSYDIALKFDLAALSAADRKQDQKAKAAAYNGIATDYMRIGDLKKSRIYYRKALAEYTQLHDSVNIGDQYYKIGVLDVDEGHMDAARILFNQAVDIFTTHSYYPGMADVYNGFASMFYIQQNLDSVAWYAEQSLQYYRLAGNTDAESFMYINLGALFNSQKNHSKALDYVKRGIALADSSGLINQLRQGYKNLSETYAMIGDWEHAYENQKLYVRYNDSIFNQQKNDAVVKYETLYQTSEKERKIQEQKTDLLEKENRIESIKNTRNILILLFVVAIISALFFVYRYITRKKINRLLDEKNKQLEEINLFKDRLFAIISHDLRSPVTSFSRVTSALNMALDKLPPQEIKKYLNDIETSAAELQHMLRGLLHWSLSQQSGAIADTKPILVSDCVNEVLSDCHGAVQEKQIQVTLEIPDGALVLADAGLLQIVIRNILSNAVKFSNLGSDILVLAKTENSNCIIDVCDHGPGVKDEVVSQLFKKMSPDSVASSSGFGLFISAELMRKMKGEVELASTSPIGSIFRITLPSAN